MTPDSTSTPGTTSGDSPAEALAFLWRGRRWIVIATLAATLVGALLAFGRGTTWRVQALITVDRGTQGLLGAGTGINNTPQPRNYANREAEVLRSVPVLSEALKRQEVAESRLLREQGNKIKWLKDRLRVHVGEEDGVLAVELDSREREDACLVVNAVVDAFRVHDLRVRGEVADQALGRLQEQLSQAENEYGAYQAELSRFLDEHPHVATFDSLRDQRIQLLTEVTPEHPAITEIDRKLSSMEEDVAVYQSLRMRSERVRTLADTLYQRIREIDVNESVDGAGGTAEAIRVWEYASPEAATVASSRAAVLLLAAFLGLMFGATLAWVTSILDDRLHRPADVASRFRLMASVPEMAGNVQVTQLWRDNPGYAGSMSTLRALLDQELQEGAKVIQVSSVGPGEGKTLVAAGLGIAMAQSQRATLIVDAHLSAPGQAHAFRHEPSKGLADLLRKQADGIPGLIWETPVRNLYVLPAGDAASDALELLNDPRFNQLVRELRARFDRIIIDSAPALESAEAHLVATACDHTLMVVAAGHTRASDAREAVSAIGSLRSNVAGMVLNRYPKVARAQAAPAPVQSGSETPARGASAPSGPSRLRVLPEAQSIDPRA